MDAALESGEISFGSEGGRIELRSNNDPAIVGKELSLCVLWLCVFFRCL
jgi:hypothetical protein